MLPRRAVLVGAGAVGLGVAGGAAAASRVEHGSVESWTPSADIWPFRRYDPANTAGNPEASVPDDPHIAWVTDNGVGESHTAPIVGPKRVYVGGNRVAAFDRADGAVRWTDDTPALRLGYRRGTLYLGPRATDGADSIPGVRALDAATGRRRWTTDSASEVASLRVGGNGTVLVGFYGGELVAYDRNGGRLWRIDDAGYGSYAAIHDGHLYAYPGFLARFEPRTLFEALMASPPRPAWRHDLTASPLSPTVRSGLVIYGSFGVRSGPGLRAVNAADGTPAWTAFPADDAQLTAITPAVVGDWGVCPLWYGDADGPADALGGIHLTDGSVRWTRRLDERPYDAVAGAETAVVATAGGPPADEPETGSVRAFNPADGNERWRVNFGRAVRSLAVVDGTVFAVLGGGRVAALR